ncbi:hypothetical protein [Virgisporangium aurantiacum]|uniref:Uncharacterized protein n=1 Tax=Virgisporangium aurantiacum TaxID=175570 RepID=A0A8J3ZFE3_9ACTN|nr:hypothetical protein [Virgisporangium aurantiacum]GIJ63107.1 hypothetical protein Vau01_106230 [Virgisporangium aurantiacum]
MKPDRCPTEGRDVARPHPLVVVTGWTASGKSTLAARFADNGLGRVTGSSVLLTLLGDSGRAKASRLRSWLSDPPPHPAAGPAFGPTARARRGGTADRLADLAVLRVAAGRSGGYVVDSAGSVPLLLSPFNDALLIRLEATATVRAARIRHLLGGRVTAEDGMRIVERKDAATAAASHASWGLDLRDPIHRRRYDLVLACPDVDVCADPQRCITVTYQIADAAFRVYSRYLTEAGDDAGNKADNKADSKAGYEADQIATNRAATRRAAANRAATNRAVADLGAVVAECQPWISGISPLLTSPLLTSPGEVSAHRWRDRLAITERATLDRPGPPHERARQNVPDQADRNQRTLHGMGGPC